MVNTLHHIVALTEERCGIYAAAGERWLSAAELVRLAAIGEELAQAWEERRQELALRTVDHGLVVMHELTAHAIGGR